MDELNNHLQDIKQIKQMMERSSQFVSLSGLSGIFAGLVGSISAYLAYLLIYCRQIEQNVFSYSLSGLQETELLLIALALLTVAFAIGGGLVFTVRKARAQHLPVWGHTSRRFVVNLLIPLLTGGLFCIILLVQQNWLMLVPAMLIFYGLALINAGHFTLNDIKFLGMIEIAFGLLALAFPPYSLAFWALGFGLSHIVYGAVMYKKYK